MSKVELAVNGRLYAGWKQVSITRSIETIAGLFSLGISERWSGQDEVWPILEQDECLVLIDGETVIHGFVDTRNPRFDSESDDLTVSGRDRAGDLVDSSVDIGRWTFVNATVLDIARAVAAQHDITVELQEGLTLPAPIPKLVINTGDTGSATILKAAKMSGVLAVSDGAGGITLTRGGTDRAAALIQGENMLSGDGRFDASRRLSSYVVLSQVAGTDKAHGKAARTRGEAVDEGVRRTNRTLVLRPATGQSRAYAQQTADWTARTRAARGARVIVTVTGWQQQTGALWRPNTISHVTSAKLGVDGDMLISQVQYLIGERGEITSLSLVRPDAFTPSPVARVKAGRSKGNFWDRVNRRRLREQG